MSLEAILRLFGGILNPFSSFLVDFVGFSWISMDFHGFHGFSWIFMDFHGF